MTTEKQNRLEKKVGPCRIIDWLLVLCITITIILVVALIVTLTSRDGGEEKKTPTVKPSTGSDKCIDVAIVGGGVGGAYIAWKLQNHSLDISVFEYSDRIGGRLFTSEFPAAPGTLLEFGGMRFRSLAHPILYKTAKDLGLNVVPFPLGIGVAEETICYTREKRMRLNDIETFNVPYKLKPEETKGTFLLFRELFQNYTDVPKGRFATEEELFNLKTTDGIPLYKMTVYNFFGKYASREAYEYIHDMRAWAFTLGTGSALASAKIYLPKPATIQGDYLTIDGGMQKLPMEMIEKFRSTSEKYMHKVHLNHWLQGIERREGGGYYLKFRKTETKDRVTTPLEGNSAQMKMCAKKVVLALQKECVIDLDFPVMKNNKTILDNLDSLVPFKAGRIFLAYKEKWWLTNSPNITHTKSDLLNRQTYEWATGTNNVHVIMASYHDGDVANYWRELSRFGTPIPGSLPGENAVTSAVKERLERYLSRIYDFPEENIPECVGGGMMLWDKFPFPAGWEMFKPNRDEKVVRQIVEKPSPIDDVFIVSGSWAPSGLNSWVEGVLLPANTLLNKYFNIDIKHLAP